MDISENAQLSELTYLQFAMKYVSCKKEKMDPEKLRSKLLHEGDEGFDMTDEMDLMVTHDFEVRKERFTLPDFIKLTNLKPGEPGYMRKRTRQVVRFHKIDSTKNPHEHYYSQLQMYTPFQDENDFFPDDAERCKQLYESLSLHNNRRRIDNVKAILMKHLDSVEEGTERAHDTKNEEVGAMMDSTHAQEQIDCELEGMSEYPDFAGIDPS